MRPWLQTPALKQEREKIRILPCCVGFLARTVPSLFILNDFSTLCSLWPNKQNTLGVILENSPNLSLIASHDQIGLSVFGKNTSQVFPRVSPQGSRRLTVSHYWWVQGNLEGVAWQAFLTVAPFLWNPVKKWDQSYCWHQLLRRSWAMATSWCHLLPKFFYNRSSPFTPLSTQLHESGGYSSIRIWSSWEQGGEGIRWRKLTLRKPVLWAPPAPAGVGGGVLVLHHNPDWRGKFQSLWVFNVTFMAEEHSDLGPGFCLEKSRSELWGWPSALRAQLAKCCPSGGDRVLRWRPLRGCLESGPRIGRGTESRKIGKPTILQATLTS